MDSAEQENVQIEENKEETFVEAPSAPLEAAAERPVEPLPDEKPTTPHGFDAIKSAIASIGEAVTDLVETAIPSPKQVETETAAPQDNVQEQVDEPTIVDNVRETVQVKQTHPSTADAPTESEPTEPHALTAGILGLASKIVGTTQEVASDAFEKTKELGLAGVDLAQSGAETVVGKATDAVEATQEVCGATVDKTKEMGAAGVDAAKSGAEVLVESSKSAIGTLQDMANSALEKAKDVRSAGMETVKSGVDTVAEKVGLKSDRLCETREIIGGISSDGPIITGITQTSGEVGIEKNQATETAPPEEPMGKVTVSESTAAPQADSTSEESRGIVGTVIDTTKAGAEKVVDVAKSGVDTVVDAGKATGEFVAETAKTGIEKTSETTSAVVDKSKELAEGALDLAKSGAQTAASGVATGAETVVDAGKSAGGFVVDTTKAGAEKVADVTKSGADAVIEAGKTATEFVSEKTADIAEGTKNVVVGAAETTKDVGSAVVGGAVGLAKGLGGFLFGGKKEEPKPEGEEQ